MAAEPQAVPTPEEEEVGTGKKKPRASKPRFGQVLNIGGQFWTVQSFDKGTVRVGRRMGNAMVEGPSLSMDEFAIASRQPLPKDVAAKGSAFASRGLSLERPVSVPEPLGGSARVTAYDAMSGDVQMDVPGRGPVWVSKNTIQNLVLPEGDRETAATALADVVEGRPPRVEPEPVAKKETDKTTKPKSPTAPTAVEPLVPEAAASEEVEQAPSATVETPVEEAVSEQTAVTRISTPPVASPPAASPVRVSRTVKVGDAPKAATPSAVKVSATVPVGTPVKEPSIRETRVELKTQIERAKPAPTSGDVKVTASVAAPATPAAAALGVAGTALNVLSADRRRPDQQLATEQQALYAKAMHALDVVSTRAAEKRGSIRDLQSQAEGLRREVSGLNAQAATPAAGGAYRTPDVSGRIQQVSTQLGNVQNKLAMARYGLQTDEAQAQQLRIATSLMKNLAPEVQRGQVPNSIVGLVAQSIPPDVPDPSPQRAVALIATLQPGVSAPPPETPPATAAETVAAPTAPAPRSYATAAPAVTERPALPSTTGLPESFRARPALTLPQATAVAFSAGQQADRASAGYQEGLGSPDAREAAFAAEGAGARPVIDTIPKSYSEAEAPEEAEDLFTPGGAGASAEFMRRQQELQAAQEQFLPGTTGTPEATTFTPETERAQRIRAGKEAGPDEESLRAAKMQADLARARAAAMQAFDIEQQEEEATGLKRIEKLRAQAESTRRNVSRLIDLFNAALGAATVETVIGAILEIGALLLNMNGRLAMFVIFKISRKKNSLMRKIFPPAQFPVEVAFIAAADILVVSVVFISVCMVLAPFIILYTLAAAGIGGIIFGIVTAAGS